MFFFLKAKIKYSIKNEEIKYVFLDSYLVFSKLHHMVLIIHTQKIRSDGYQALYNLI